MPLIVRPISPTAIQATLSNNATAAPAQPTTRTVRVSPRHSSRPSPKSNHAASRPCKRTILSLLGILIIFSVVTNVFIWRENTSNQNVDGWRMEAAWSPPISRNYRLRRVFRDGKSKRQTRDSDSVQRGNTADNSPSDQIRGFQRDQHEKHNATYSHRMRNTKWSGSIQKTKSADAIKYKKKRKKSRERPRQRRSFQSFQPQTKQIESSVDEKIKENHNTQPEPPQQKLRSFRIHPSRKKSRSPPWILPLPAPATESIKLNTLVLLDSKHTAFNRTSHERVGLDDWLARYHESKQSGNSTEEDLALTSQTVVWDNDEECVPMSDWQTTFHPTCNSIHEIDISLLLHGDAFSLVSSKGHWRNAWKVDMTVAETHGAVNVESSLRTDRSKGQAAAANKYAVVKSLKYIHDPNEEVFELSRVDAVSLDVLTQSRFTINIYGFCGTSSMQEFAGGDLKGLLPKLDPIDKLRMAAWIAEGVADIHGVDLLDSGHADDKRMGSPEIDTTETDILIPPLIHNDINMDNVLLGYRQGVKMPLLNDFNIAVFRKKKSETGEPCRFRGRFTNPQWMSPEQQEPHEGELSAGYLNEKIDIYALGNIFYKIAVGNSPWKYEYKAKNIDTDLKAKIARAKLRGAKPKLPPEVRNSTDHNVKAVLTAMDRCYRNDANLRPSARELADYLNSALGEVEIPIGLVEPVQYLN